MSQDPDFAQIAKRTLAYLKYTTFPPPLLPVITKALQAAFRDPLWHTRAATLHFSQAFTYRHLFALSAADAAAIRSGVLALLEDPQLEVRVSRTVCELSFGGNINASA